MQWSQQGGWVDGQVGSRQLKVWQWSFWQSDACGRAVFSHNITKLSSWQ